MFPLPTSLKKQQTLALTTVALISLSSALLPTRTVRAHEVEIEGDVGATLHIEPNDTPKAGEEVLAWFALTRPGGETIPLENCDCTLAIYAQPEDQPYEGETPNLEPELSAVDAEIYQDIPGATLTFPSVGTYTMVISGTPKQEGDFTPFSLAFEKTIAAGIAEIPEDESAALPPPEASAEIASTIAEPTETLNSFGVWAIAGLGLAGLLAALFSFLRRSK